MYMYMQLLSRLLTISDIRVFNFKISNYGTEFKFDKIKRTSFIATP